MVVRDGLILCRGQNYRGGIMRVIDANKRIHSEARLGSKCDERSLK